MIRYGKKETDNVRRWNWQWSANEIGKEGAKALSEAMRINTTLTKLDLDCIDEEEKKWKRAKKKWWWTANRIGDEGAKAIGEAMKSNTALIELDLRCKDGKKRKK